MNCLVDLALGDAVVDAGDCLSEDWRGEVVTEARARLLDPLAERVVFQFRLAAIRPPVREDAGSPLLGAGLTVENVAPRDAVLPGAHQRALDLILNLLDPHIVRLLLAPDHHACCESGDLRRCLRCEGNIGGEIEFGAERLLDRDADALAVKGGR